MIADNSYTNHPPLRRPHDHRFIAEWLQSTEAWEPRCYEADTLLDERQDDEPWQAARALIEAPFIGGDDKEPDGAPPTP
jgi:hypothetical protein